MFALKLTEISFRNIGKRLYTSSHQKKRYILPTTYTTHSISMLLKLADAWRCYKTRRQTENFECSRQFPGGYRSSTAGGSAKGPSSHLTITRISPKYQTTKPMTTDRSALTTDHWPQFVDRWPLTADRSSLATVRWPQFVDRRPLTAGRWPQSYRSMIAKPPPYRKSHLYTLAKKSLLFCQTPPEIKQFIAKPTRSSKEIAVFSSESSTQRLFMKKTIVFQRRLNTFVMDFMHFERCGGRLKGLIVK